MNQDLQTWNNAAESWDQIANKETYRTLLIEDAMNKLFSDCHGLKILDAGCGNGYFTKWLAERGANVLGIDGSEKLLKIAKEKNPGLKFELKDLSQITDFSSQEFDVYLANMLLMHVSGIDTLLAEARRILKPEGKLIFSILHPCFNQPTAKLYKSLWSKLTFQKPAALAFDYFSPKQGRFEAHMGNQLTHYHRTLEEYSQALKKAGFAIQEILEPHSLPETFLKKNPKLEYATRLPRFIFLNCKLS
jgi:2-polyprenyl-3-methyl-5-hydroxy-6-metoxy-1,4-benzoquinol methylase